MSNEKRYEDIIEFCDINIANETISYIKSLKKENKEANKTLADALNKIILLEEKHKELKEQKQELIKTVRLISKMIEVLNQARDISTKLKIYKTSFTLIDEAEKYIKKIED